MSQAEKRPKVLIVDDDEGLVRLIGKALEREGWRSSCAASGAEAREVLAQASPDLMLLDLKLPDLEARELVEQLALAGRCPPFIIITGQGDERVAVDMMRRGARDYMVKDASFLEFLPTVVKRALNQIDNERRLADAQAQVHLMQKQLLEISEQERRRIGQDLHDGLCQHLAGIELMSQVLEQKLAKRSKADATRAGEIARYVRDAISQTRSLARGLFPVTLESEGLASALVELGAGTEKLFGVVCNIDCAGPVMVESLSVSTHLYRIAQEAVTNAIKHGKATRIAIRLESTEGRTLLTITDNGRGFPELPPRQTGMGLRIMHYRTAMIGGRLSLENVPGGGARVIYSVADTA